MKQPQLTPLLLSATLFLVGATARAEEPAAPVPAPEPARDQRHAEILKKFDKNGDGKLDDTERVAAREAAQAWRKEHRQAMRRPEGPEMGRKAAQMDPAFRRGYMLGKFDANNDGKLDDTEKAAMRTFVENRIRTGVEKQLTKLRAIDTDNDGKISDAEWAVAKDKFHKEHPGMPAMAEDGLPLPPPPHREGGPGPGGLRGPMGDEDEEDAS